jgi:hypothetical protein
MASWAKCSDQKGKALWINLDNVTTITTIMLHDAAQEGTEVVFVGGGQVIVRERPENLTKSC